MLGVTHNQALPPSPSKGSELQYYLEATTNCYWLRQYTAVRVVEVMGPACNIMQSIIAGKVSSKTVRPLVHTSNLAMGGISIKRDAMEITSDRRF